MDPGAIDMVVRILCYNTENGPLDRLWTWVHFLWGSICYGTYDNGPHRIWTPRSKFYGRGPYSVIDPHGGGAPPHNLDVFYSLEYGPPAGLGSNTHFGIKYK